MALDTAKLQQQLADILKPAIQQLIAGVEDDIAAYLLTISRSALEAINEGSEDRLRELHLQLRALGELNRLRAVNVSWDVIDSVINVAIESVKMMADELIDKAKEELPL